VRSQAVDEVPCFLDFCVSFGWDGVLELWRHHRHFLAWLMKVSIGAMTSKFEQMMVLTGVASDEIS